MKNLILALVAFITAYAAHRHPDQPSTHGMLVVGKTKLYASHLPMFHSPHDYQAILEIEIDQKSKYLAAQGPDYFTLAPELGILPEMAQAGRTFKAELYKGHFERGGEKIADTLVTVTKVLYFKQFDPLAIKPSELQVFLFGNTKEQFAAHLIAAKPDFDQILEVETQAEGPLSFANVANKPLVGSIPNLRVKKSVYTETGDLSF